MPADCVIETVKHMDKDHSGNAIDIGAGQGRNSAYLLESGYSVIAIDNSLIACQQLRQLNYPNLTVLNVDASKYIFEKNKFDIVLAINLLHLMKKDDSMGLLYNLKNSLKESGVITISILLDNGKFMPNELQKQFMEKNYEIIKYSENKTFDKGHPGSPAPHFHKIATVIAKKINSD